jgi:hypothetical protein
MKHWNNATAKQRTAEQYPSHSAVLSVVEAAYTPGGPAQHGLFSNKDDKPIYMHWARPSPPCSSDRFHTHFEWESWKRRCSNNRPAWKLRRCNTMVRTVHGPVQAGVPRFGVFPKVPAGPATEIAYQYRQQKWSGLHEVGVALPAGQKLAVPEQTMWLRNCFKHSFIECTTAVLECGCGSAQTIVAWSSKAMK